MKRDQIFGGIGIVWGGFTVMNWYRAGRPVTPDEARQGLVSRQRGPALGRVAVCAMQIADIRERDGNLPPRSRPGLLRRAHLIHQDVNAAMPVEKMMPIRAESDLHVILLLIMPARQRIE